MASSIDVTKPSAGSATTASVRQNFSFAKSEIEALQSDVAGLVIGTDVQAYDAGLASIAGLTTSANQIIYTTASDTYATTTLSAFARTILDDADANAVRVTIGAGTGNGDVTGPGTAAAGSWARFTAGSTLAASSWVEGDSGTVVAGGSLNMADAVLSRPELIDVAETVVTADTGSAYAISLASGNVFNLRMTSNTTLSFSNPPATSKSGSFLLHLAQDTAGSRAITWPASVDWAGGAAPTITSSSLGKDIYVFNTIDGGTTWYGSTVGQAFA